MATQMQTMPRWSRTEGMPAPPEAYPLQPYDIYGRPNSAPLGSLPLQPPQPEPPPPDLADDSLSSDDGTNGSIKGEDDNNQKDDNQQNDDNQPDNDDP